MLDAPSQAITPSQQERITQVQSLIETAKQQQNQTVSADSPVTEPRLLIDALSLFIQSPNTTPNTLTAARTIKHKLEAGIPLSEVEKRFCNTLYTNNIVRLNRAQDTINTSHENVSQEHPDIAQHIKHTQEAQKKLYYILVSKEGMNPHANHGMLSKALTALRTGGYTQEIKTYFRSLYHTHKQNESVQSAAMVYKQALTALQQLKKSTDNEYQPEIISSIRESLATLYESFTRISHYIYSQNTFNSPAVIAQLRDVQSLITKQKVSVYSQNETMSRVTTEIQNAVSRVITALENQPQNRDTQEYSFRTIQALISHVEEVYNTGL